MKPKAFFPAKGRPLALDPQALGVEYAQHVQPEEPLGLVACLCIEGPLVQRSDGWFDGYDSIQDRFAAVMAMPEVRAVVMKFDSPGGDVAGLFEAARAMTEMKTKPVIAYVDEACYSAAYALAMVADELYLPPSAGVGSVGVITCMVDATAANEKAGIKVQVITSGDHKADGNPDVELTDDAIARTQERVDELADMFFALVSQSRGISIDEIKSYEAGIFQGAKAVSAGLADGVMSFDDLVDATIELIGANNKQESDMAATGKLAAIREANEKAAAALEAPAAEVKYKHTKKSVEVLETEDDPTAEKDDDSEDEDGDEDAPPKKKKDDAKAMAALIAEVTGKKSSAAQRGVLMAMKDSHGALAQRVQQLEAERSAEKLSALVTSGLKAGKLMPAQRQWALSQAPETLKAYLDATPKMVHAVNEEHVPSAEADVSASAELAARFKAQGWKDEEIPNLIKLHGKGNHLNVVKGGR